MNKEVGRVTEDERDVIQAIYERQNGLNELAKILTADNVELYNRLITDMGETSTKFENWWRETSAKYGWESVENGSWEIDFNSCKIYLVIPE